MNNLPCWTDTKLVARDLNISNRGLLKLLETTGITRKDKQGYKQVTTRGKELARSMPRCWINNSAHSYDQQQYYSVIQLNQQGIEFCEQQIRNAKAN